MAIEAEAEDVATRLQAEFPRALESGQVVAYFQPEVELSSGKVVAAEALARWEHPALGTLSPGLFVPLAEKLGLMAEFTQRMLRLSLAQHRIWAADGWDIPISVNVGPDCMKDPEFPAVVAEVLRSERVSGSMLALEVSEQTGTASVSPGFFAQLAELGVKVALDDFGTGFASLESLGGWPVYELKLDMSIVRPIASNSNFRAIVRTTIDLAHQLGVEVVAEGVESEAVRSELEALGCDLAQGFLLGRPMPPDAFADWLREHQRSARRRGGSGQQNPPAEAAADGDTGEMGSAYRRLADACRRVVALIGVRTLAAALGMFAVYGLWQIFRWGGHQHQALIGDLAYFPVNGAAALCAWQVSRRKDLGQARRPWRLISAALWLYLLGDALQFVYEVVLHELAYPTWADAGYLSFYVVALIGLLTFPSRRRTRSERVPAAARHGHGLRRRLDAHLVHRARARRGFGSLRSRRHRDLLLPDRRPAAPVRGAVAAVAGYAAAERHRTADLRMRHGRVHRRRPHLRLHHRALHLSRRRPCRHPVVHRADDPAGRDRMPAARQADHGVRHAGPGFGDPSQRAALPRGRGQLRAAHRRGSGELHVRPPGRSCWVPSC